MTSLSHYATCQVWPTGNWKNCDCQNQPPWRIRKEAAEPFAWRIWRWTDDGTYEHFLRASSWRGAVTLVSQFSKLYAGPVDGERNVHR